MQHNRNPFSKFLLVIMSIIFALLLAEILCRYYYYGKLSMGYQTPDSRFVRYDEQVGWSVVPNSEGFFANLSEGYNGYVKFDENGIRLNDNHVGKEDNTILVIGDSTTAGLEVDNNDTYVAILEKLFYQNGCKIRVYNAGVRGYGTDQSLWNLERLQSIIKPSYVIYMFSNNDFMDNRTIKKSYRIYGKPAFVYDNDKLSILNKPTKKFAYSYYSIVEYNTAGYKVITGYSNDALSLVKKFLKDNLALYHPLHNVYEYLKLTQMTNAIEKNSNKDIKLLELILMKMKSHDYELFIAPFPDANTKAYVSDLKRLSDKIGIKYIDIAPYFSDRSKKYHWKYDRHWNKEGHLQAAKALYEILSPQLCIQ